MGERITDDVIANCPQCGAPCDAHTNCANDACHVLFIRCDSCKENIITLVLKNALDSSTSNRRARRRKEGHTPVKSFKNRLRPGLMNILKREIEKNKIFAHFGWAFLFPSSQICCNSARNMRYLWQN